MISGIEIIEQVKLGNITINPFDPKQAGPNSYDLRLGPEIARVVGNARISPEFACSDVIDTHVPGSIIYEKMLDNGAFILLPGELYLGHTVETIGSKYYAPLLHGRSTAARFGIMVHLTAGFGDVGWIGKYVLELRNMTPYPILVYPCDRICQVEFEQVRNAELYKSTYQNQNGIMPAKGLQDEAF